MCALVLPDLTPDASPWYTPPLRNEDHHSTVPSELTPDISPLTISPARSEDEFQNSQMCTPLPSPSLSVNEQSQRDSTSPPLPLEITIDTDEHIIASGGDDLTEKGKFLETQNLLYILCLDGIVGHECIPVGLKENKFFVFDNTANIRRHHNSNKSQFWDDCGAWVSGPTNTAMFLRSVTGKLTEVVLHDSLYGTVLYKRANGGRQRIVTPLEPQPHPESIIVLHRAYAKHTQSGQYKRRISWIEQNMIMALLDGKQKVAVAEYIGTFPGRVPHGSSKHCSRNYIRTKGAVLDNMKEQVQHCPPNQVWQSLDDSGEMGGPRSRKQVANMRYMEKKQRQRLSQKNQVNFTDHVQNIETMVKTHEFVQRVEVGKDKVPAIILYTENQLLDIKRFCCSAPLAHSTVLGVDKTFNLGDVHVTVCVFKHLAVTRRDTNDHPIFAGPFYLHGNSDFLSYNSFFSHLAGKLRGNHHIPSLAQMMRRQ